MKKEEVKLKHFGETKTILTLTRKELTELLEQEFKIKFEQTRLSSTGFKGWY